MNKTITQTIPIAWHHIRDARKLVETTLSDLDKEVRSAAVMTMSELVENAMKYGESTPQMPGATFTLDVGDGTILIKVANGTCSTDSVETLRKTIDAIATTEDKEALYAQRLHEMLANPHSGSRLGLYRIGLEGRFDLSFEYENDIVTVTARRQLT